LLGFNNRERWRINFLWGGLWTSAHLVIEVVFLVILLYDGGYGLLAGSGFGYIGEVVHEEVPGDEFGIVERFHIEALQHRLEDEVEVLVDDVHSVHEEQVRGMFPDSRHQAVLISNAIRFQPIENRFQLAHGFLAKQTYPELRRIRDDYTVLTEDLDETLTQCG
jgi:hypothetical protein